MDKTLYELGTEYDTYAKEIRAQIKACQAKPKSMENFKKIEMLRDIERDLRSNSEHLKKYYDKERKIKW